MKMTLLSLFASVLLLGATGCKKDALAENEKQIKKLWKLDAYLVNGTDKTAQLRISNYTESYTDNGKYDRSYHDATGDPHTQNGTWTFENATRLKVSGVGSIQFTSEGTISSSYYDIIRLNESEFWYGFTNGGARHEFRLSRK